MTDTDDDALFQLYNRELMALSAQVAAPKTLARPDAKATVVSIVCGSEVTVELSLQGRQGWRISATQLKRAR